MTPEALNTLARYIAEAAAKCVGATTALQSTGRAEVTPSPTLASPRGEYVSIVADARGWSARAEVHGAPSAALNSAAVLALRDRVAAQREERARMLAADDAALRVIDETARVYDAATIVETAGDNAARADAMRRWLDGRGPWSREEAMVAVTVTRGNPSATLDACDAILRRRAGAT